MDRQIRETIIKICENLSDNYTVEIVEEGRNAPTSISGKGVEVIEELKKFQEDLEKREGW
ncbi:MAG: hypothetical protein LBR45_03710 [Bacteroidales bacterium]|nr:hypothetical protein [Bacteroidales bacterium]